LRLPRGRSYTYLELAQHHELRQPVVLLGRTQAGERLTVRPGALVMSGINMLQHTHRGPQQPAEVERNGPDRIWRVENGMVHTAQIEEGLSGGPLLDLEGNLLGINAATGMLTGSALTFAISAESFRSHLPHLGGDLPEVSAGPGGPQAAGLDDLDRLRSPLTEALWTMEGLDRLALASGLPSERVAALSREVTNQLYVRNSQGGTNHQDLVAWVWNNYFAALKREHHTVMQEQSRPTAGAQSHH
jgi:hypothetical protein